MYLARLTEDLGIDYILVFLAQLYNTRSFEQGLRCKV